jgi:Protein of unknown function with HXXEE motif
MKKLTFQTALLLAPLAYAIHHFEEHIIFNFRDWRLQYFSDNNPLSTEAVFIILTAITLVYIIIHAITENKASAQSVILFLMATQVANVIFHTGGTILFRHFSPGLITAILLYLPVNFIIAKKAYQEGWVTRKSLTILFLSGSLLFSLFEFLGPAPMVTVLVVTYIWVAFTTIKRKGAA